MRLYRTVGSGPGQLRAVILKQADRIAHVEAQVLWLTEQLDECRSRPGSPLHPTRETPSVSTTRRPGVSWEKRRKCPRANRARTQSRYVFMICVINVHRSLKLCDPRDPKMTDALCARFFPGSHVDNRDGSSRDPRRPRHLYGRPRFRALECEVGVGLRCVRVRVWRSTAACAHRYVVGVQPSGASCKAPPVSPLRTRSNTSEHEHSAACWVVRERRVIVHGCSELFLDRHVELELLSQLLCQV